MCHYKSEKGALIYVAAKATYRVGQKKVNPKCSTHNFVKYWPILKILSLL